MDFSLSEEQEMLRKMARDFLTEQCPKNLVREMAEDEKGYSPKLWKDMSDLGWMGLVFPEKYGGGSGSFLDLTILVEEMGRACFPGPFFSTVVLGGLAILEAGNEEQKRELLTKVAKGELLLTLALTEPSVSYDASSITVKATPNNNNYIINGTKLFVPDAHVADYIICVARADEGITLFLVDAKSPGIEKTVLKTIAGDKQCELSFTGVKVPQWNMLGGLGQGRDVVEKILAKAKVAKCADMVGVSQQALEMAVDYAKQRVQYEVHIGSFEVIQHYCADMAIDVDSSRFITYDAAWRLSEKIPCAKEVAIAKAWVSEACQRVVSQAIHIFGSIGMSEDHDMPLYYKRAKAAELAFGSSEPQHELVAREMGV